MKNMSIRSRILAGVILANLLGALAMVVYLHQSYSSGLDVTATKSVNLGVASWEQIKGEDKQFDLLKDGESVAGLIERMKKVTGADYGVLLAKSATDEQAYAQYRQSANLANNWDEREGFVLVGTTDEAVAEKMQFGVEPESVPEIGKVVGVENGACSKMCHDTVKGQGDYWGVEWSTDSKSRAHAVFPVTDASGKPVAIVYSIEDISGQANAARTSLLQTLIVIGITLVGATLFIGALIDTLVFRRLAKMIQSMQDLSVRVAGGDFDARFEPDGTSDEIGRFEQFFANLMDLMTATLRSLVKEKKAAG